MSHEWCDDGDLNNAIASAEQISHIHLLLFLLGGWWGSLLLGVLLLLLFFGSLLGSSGGSGATGGDLLLSGCDQLVDGLGLEAFDASVEIVVGNLSSDVAEQGFDVSGA